MNNKHQIKYKTRFPKKIKAHSVINDLVKAGKLIKEPCIICGALKVEAHHDDYSKPLDIKWLCREHHLDIHYPNRHDTIDKSLIFIDGKYRNKNFSYISKKETITSLRSEGLSYSKIGKQLNLSRSQVYKIHNNTIYS